MRLDQNVETIEELKKVCTLANDLALAITSDDGGAQPHFTADETTMKLEANTRLAKAISHAEPAVIAIVTKYARISLVPPQNRYLADFTRGAADLMIALQSVLDAAIGNGRVVVNGNIWDVADYGFPFGLSFFENNGRVQLNPDVEGMDDIRETVNVPDDIRVDPDVLEANINKMRAAARKSGESWQAQRIDRTKVRTVQAFQGDKAYLSEGKFYGGGALYRDILMAIPVTVDLAIFGEPMKGVREFVHGIKQLASGSIDITD